MQPRVGGNRFDQVGVLRKPRVGEADNVAVRNPDPGSHIVRSSVIKYSVSPETPSIVNPGAGDGASSVQEAIPEANSNRTAHRMSRPCDVIERSVFFIGN